MPLRPVWINVNYQCIYVKNIWWYTFGFLRRVEQVVRRYGRTTASTSSDLIMFTWALFSLPQL